MPQRKPKLLFVTHAFNNLGGVELHLKTLARLVSENYTVSVVYPEAGRLALLEDFAAGGAPSYLAGEQLSILAPYRSAPVNSSVKEIIARLTPDLIHLVHYVYWPLSIIEQLLNAAAPLVISHHDYYSITPYFTMQGTADPQDTLSAEYSLGVFGQDLSAYLERRRDLLGSVLPQSPWHVVPSQHLRSRLSGVFPLEMRIIPYGITPFTAQLRTAAKPPVFGYLGSLLPQKGWELLLQAFQRVRSRHAAARLRLYGGCPEWPELPPGVTFQPAYQPEDLPRILGEFDVGVIPSLFEETFSIVLSELQQGGRPAAVSNSGALAERIVDGQCGLQFKSGDLHDMSRALTWFLESESWRYWSIPQPPLAADMAAAYEEVYEQALSAG